MYNVPEVATNYFQTTIYFDIYDDEGFILSDYIEIGRDEIDPNEPDLTTTEVLNIPKGRENTKATLKITGILVGHDGYYLAKLPKMYIMGYEGPIAELYDVTTEINEPLTVPFLYPGDQRLVGFEIDLKDDNVLGEITLVAYDIEEMSSGNPNMKLLLTITMDLVNDNNNKFTVNSEAYIEYEKATGKTLYESVTNFSVPKDFENATGNITINSIYITSGGGPYDIPIVYMTVYANRDQLYSATDVWQTDLLDLVLPIITKGSFKKLKINCQF